MPPPGHAMNTLTGQPIYTFREEEEGSVAGPEMLKLRPALARLQYKSVFIYHVLEKIHIQREDEAEGSVGGPEMLELRPYFAH